jgi:hypothetical protein
MRGRDMSSTIAYLDPGTSSMILQIIAGGLAAAGVATKLFWGRILRFLHIRKDEPADEVKSDSDSR